MKADMAYELFQREKSVLAGAKERLEGDGFADEEEAKVFGALLKNYEKLFKETRRLVRMSDRSQDELSRLAKSLNEKNRMLETLSKKLSKYLSPQVYSSIFTGQRDVALSTERKKLTVFFSDIKDFTATTADLEPEELANLLNHYLTEMSNIALEYGATIDKFVGDAVVLFFGDPETRGVKEDALACVRMAVAMQRRMNELQEVWHQMGYERPFQVRIGINTGFCNVGNFGSEDRMDYTIIGGEVNLAARLEGIAEPGGIVMAYETFALVRDRVYAEAGEPIRVKGIPREVRPYRVIGLQDELAIEDRFIRKEQPGMQLFIDLHRMEGLDRAAAIADMQETIATIDRRSVRRKTTAKRKTSRKRRAPPGPPSVPGDLPK